MIYRHIERCLRSLKIRELQIKPQLTKTKTKNKLIGICEDIEKLEPCNIAGGELNSETTVVAIPQNTKHGNTI
jgi:hypothetical protein